MPLLADQANLHAYDAKRGREELEQFNPFVAANIRR
jgi:hypothetical protein